MLVQIPINFGHRPCDRLLVRSLTASGSLDRSTILWMAFLVWQDFATAREDRRDIPRDSIMLSSSDTVAILEDFIGWKGRTGGFITAGVEAGFFSVTPISDTASQLVLVDFFPANANASRIGNSELGGVGGVYKRLKSRSEVAAADQLRLFESTGTMQIEGVSDRDKKAAIRLIHAICLALRRPPPSNETWKEHLIKKAVDLVVATTEADRECVLKWFVKYRSSQRISNRLDLIIDQFQSFVKEAVQIFGK